MLQQTAWWNKSMVWVISLQSLTNKLESICKERRRNYFGIWSISWMIKTYKMPLCIPIFNPLKLSKSSILLPLELLVAVFSSCLSWLLTYIYLLPTLLRLSMNLSNNLKYNKYKKELQNNLWLCSKRKRQSKINK